MKFRVNWHFGKGEKDRFQGGGRGGHLGFQFGMILAICYLQEAPILPINFRFNGALGLSSRTSKLFSRWQQWCPDWISDRNNLTMFYLQVTLKRPTKLRVTIVISDNCRMENF